MEVRHYLDIETYIQVENGRTTIDIEPVEVYVLVVMSYPDDVDISITMVTIGGLTLSPRAMLDLLGPAYDKWEEQVFDLALEQLQG